VEAIFFNIWNRLSETFGPYASAMALATLLIVWGLYRHIGVHLLDSLGEWLDLKWRNRLSLPPKQTPPGK